MEHVTLHSFLFSTSTSCSILTKTAITFSFAQASRPAPHLLSAQARDAALAAALFEATEAVIAGAGVALPPL